MANPFLALFDNLLQKQGPTLRNWQHASRLYINNSLEYAPKTKFLYHVTFHLNPDARAIAWGTYSNLIEIGMLVKNADLPKYTAKTQIMNMYNRKKNIQTAIEYQPVTITLHDDNVGATRSLLS